MTKDDAQAEVERLYGEWMDAAAGRDSDWYRANLAAEFVYITYEGNIRTLDELIAVNKLSKNSAYRLLDVRGARHGDVLLAFGTYTGKGELDPEVPASEELRAMYGRAYGGGVELAFSGSWVEREGRLQCLHLHTTQVL